MRIRAICFDAFGTLVEIVDKRRPFRALLQGRGACIPAEEILIKPLGLQEVAARLNHKLASDDLARIEQDLRAECDSIRLRQGIEAIWQSLRQKGTRIGVCSNLALPYGPPLLATLPDTPDAVVLSYEVGLAKPDPSIFRLVCERLERHPAEVLFVGDTPAADIEGPRAIGMPAMPISTFERYAASHLEEIGELPDDFLSAMASS
ncbi:HAD family hydrolase [Microvirga rosea]|uniref:HAD family hydrolase n=1 Tax=Microvirga rosea TaxID=2715425 RepID=UPI001D09F943|nr:HAD family hydrolase [Microvirga rosea]MCB8823315.1 HAD family hydrolase [Microvirga rosea]